MLYKNYFTVLEDLYEAYSSTTGLDAERFRSHSTARQIYTIPKPSIEACFAAGVGTQECPYEIATEAQLRQFAQSLSDTEQYENTYIQLTNDIVLSEQLWMPVGNGHDPFRGHFDGQNHKISGLKIGTEIIPYLDLSGQNAIGYFGLFGVLSNGASVSNLALDVEVYVTSSQSCYLGGLAGYATHAVIENVHVTGILHGASHHPKANLFVGGVCGNCYQQKIQHCSSQVRIHAETIGGMAEAGGIVGFHNRGDISYCQYAGQITSHCDADLNGRSVLGGIAGVHAGSISNCYMTAPLARQKQNDYVGTIAGWATGISATSDSFYCIDYCIDDTPAALHPLKCTVPFGCSVGKGKNNFGESYAGCIVYNVVGFDAQTMQEELQHQMQKIAI